MHWQPLFSQFLMPALAELPDEELAANNAAFWSGQATFGVHATIVKQSYHDIENLCRWLSSRVAYALAGAAACDPDKTGPVTLLDLVDKLELLEKTVTYMVVPSRAENGSFDSMHFASYLESIEQTILDTMNRVEQNTRPDTDQLFAFAMACVCLIGCLRV